MLKYMQALETFGSSLDTFRDILHPNLSLFLIFMLYHSYYQVHFSHLVTSSSDNFNNLQSDGPSLFKTSKLLDMCSLFLPLLFKRRHLNHVNTIILVLYCFCDINIVSFTFTLGVQYPAESP